MDKIKKNKLLIILISFISIVCIFSNTTSCYASLGEIISGADDFIYNGVADNSYTIEGNHLQSMSDLLYNTLFIIAIVVAVIIGMVIAIQFMTAILHNPELIVLDEPFSGLDPVNSEILKKVIIQLINEGKYIIMSSHQMPVIEEFCSDLVILNKGKTVLKGNLNKIKESYPANRLLLSVDKKIDKTIKEFNLEIENCTDNNYTIKIQDEETPNKLLAKLVEDKVLVTKFEINKPTLNDIFIEKVGE